jgi:hypothetical protein
VVVIATPIDLRRLVDIKHPTVRVGYELEEIGRPKLEDVLGEFFARRSAKRPAEKKAGARPASRGRVARAAKKPPSRPAPRRKRR